MITSANNSVNASCICYADVATDPSIRWAAILKADPMAEMSVLWLRVAAVLYSLGLLHSILAITRKSEGLFRVALNAARAGAIVHAVSIVEEGVATGHCP